MDDTKSLAQDGRVDGASEQDLAEVLVARAREQGLELTGPDGLRTGLTKRVLETALEVEMAAELGYERGDPAGAGSGNNRNGHHTKKVHTEVGTVEIKVPPAGRAPRHGWPC
jgi:putative transposase